MNYYDYDMDYYDRGYISCHSFSIICTQRNNVKYSLSYNENVLSKRLHRPASTRGNLGVGYGIASDDSPTARVLHKYSSLYSLHPTLCLTGGFMNATAQ